LTMSNSPRFQQSSRIRAGVEFCAAHRRSKAPGSGGTPSLKPALPFSESRVILSDSAK